jgi:hypothetical protein
MADVVTLRAQLVELRKAFRSGASKVAYEGKSIEYRDTAGMRAAIAAIEAELAALEGTSKPRAIVVRGQKDW